MIVGCRSLPNELFYSVNELHEVSIFSFLQSVKVPLGGTPTLQRISGSPPQHAIICDLAESMFCPFAPDH